MVQFFYASQCSMRGFSEIIAFWESKRQQLFQYMAWINKWYFLIRVLYKDTCW